MKGVLVRYLLPAALCVGVFFVNLQVTGSMDQAFVAVLLSLGLGYVIPLVVRKMR